MDKLHYSFTNLKPINCLKIQKNDNTEKEFKYDKFKNSFSYSLYFKNCFVPKLKPKTSSIIPTYLNLDKINKNEPSESNENNSVKEVSVEKDSYFDDSSTSSKLDEQQNEDEKNSGFSEEDESDKHIKKLNFKDNFKGEKEIKLEKLQRISITTFRHKMYKIKNKVLCKQNKEYNEIIHDEFKKKYNIDNKYINLNEIDNILKSQKNILSDFASLHDAKKSTKKPLLIRDVLINLSKKKQD